MNLTNFNFVVAFKDFTVSRQKCALRDLPKNLPSKHYAKKYSAIDDDADSLISFEKWVTV